jgi:TolB-like protein
MNRIRFLSGTVLMALLLQARAGSQTAPIAENAPPPACADAACALDKAQSLLRNGDTLGAYALLVTYPLFSNVDTTTVTMINFAAFVKPSADRLSAQKAIREERSYQPNTIQGSIAVAPFVNIGASEELQPLSAGLPEMLTTDLSQVKRFTLLERAQISALSTEMALGRTGLLDSQYAPRMGKLMGAQWVVTGSFSGTGKAIVICSSLRRTSGDSGICSTKVQCALTGFFKAEKELVFSMVNKLGIVLTDDERKAVETIPTENVLAYLAYCKGLQSEERGDFDAAKDRYKAALDLDPKFEKAKSGLDRASTSAKLGKPAKKSAEKGGAADLKNTAVFSIGPLHLSSISFAAIASMNTAMAGFMPERPLVSVPGRGVGPANGLQGASAAGTPSETERNSYIDATGTDLNSVPSSIKARIPIPAGIK